MKSIHNNIHTFHYNSTKSSKKSYATILDYRAGPKKNVTFQIPKLVENIIHMPHRYLDLLELASYVYCADRYVRRGNKESPYFSGWQRHFKHVAFVRDYGFWSDPTVVDLLQKLLSFLSGDIHEFEFHSGHSTPKAHMFDGEEFLLPSKDNIQIVLFSGGLDSTSGIYDILVKSQKNLILASHSSQHLSKKIQRLLVEEMKRLFPGRVHHVIFECNLSGGVRAPEETQRTRSFLYAAVGSAIARAYGQNNLSFFENGILSINLPPSEQYQNARATRTTHPKVIYYLSQLFTLINEKTFTIDNPFLWLTKTDIASLLKSNKGIPLLNNTVSCSRVFDPKVKHNRTHCGRCSQCIDRRFALAAADMLDDEDIGIYAYDFVIDNICPDNDSFSKEERTMLVDYVRLAITLNGQNSDTFQDKWLEQLTDIVDVIDGFSETDKIEKLHDLFKRHGKQVMDGIHSFRKRYENEMLGEKPASNSLSEILDKKEYLDAPHRLVATKIIDSLSKSIPIAFQSSVPQNEHELQDYVEAFFSTNADKWKREHPYVQFALAKSVPDFSLKKPCVYIEIKYLRGKTTPSKINAQIAEDCTKYPDDAFLLFIIYDPHRQVKDDKTFADEFERKRDCILAFIR